MGKRLLEREGERRALARAMGSLRRGRGAAVMVSGPAGIGKTSLLEDAAGRAAGSEVEVLRAAGDEFERDLAFGVARQLLGPRRAKVGQDEASAMLALDGALARLAASRLVVLLVDDVQWADTPSLRLLVYVARRLGERPIAMITARRTGEPDPGGLLDALARHSDVITPAPLSPEAVAELLGSDTLAGAVHEATGGNPFYAKELAGLLAGGDVSADELPTTGSEAVRDAVLRRIRREGQPALAVARAVAILAPHAELRHVAALSGMQLPAAARFVDGLAAADVLDPGMTIGFVHPIVRTTVLDGIPATERALAHRTAARLLDDGGAQAEIVGGHLVAAPPTGETWVVDALRRAAHHASPESACAFLRRAMAEPPPRDARHDVALELGRAETAAFSAQAVPRLRAARDEAPTRLDRAHASVALAAALSMEDRREECGLILDALVAELQGAEDLSAEERDLLLRAQTTRVHEGLVEPGGLPALRDLAWPCQDEVERVLLANVAHFWVGLGSADKAAEMARRAATGAPMSDPIGPAAAGTALAWADALEEAAEVSQALLVAGQREGTASRVVWGRYLLAGNALRRGELALAAEQAGHLLDLARELEMTWAMAPGFGLGAMVALEREGPEAAAAVLADTAIDDDLLRSLRGALVLIARGRVHLATRGWDAALEDLHAAGERLGRYHSDHPASYPWRSLAASALTALDRAAEARELVDEELALARRWGAARPIGVALTALARLEDGAEAIATLEEAVGVLEPSAARLDRARSLLELGAALRRRGERAACRAPLKQALALAHDCGAGPLEARVAEELAATGARPRSVLVSGLESLTASERRVAELAAEGMTSKEIAQVLVVSRKTVDNQLSHVYRKLDIRSRRELPGALSAC